MNPLSNREYAIQELGIESLPPEMQDELIGQYGQFIITEIILAVLRELPSDAQETFKTLSEEGKGDEAEALASQHIPNFLVFMAEETKKALVKIKEMRASLG